MEKKRPVLIVQNNLGNRYSPKTIVAAIHSETGKGLPVHVSVPKGIGGLSKDSVIDCGVLVTVDKTLLQGKLGELPLVFSSQVDKALRISLALA